MVEDPRQLEKRSLEDDMRALLGLDRDDLDHEAQVGEISRESKWHSHPQILSDNRPHREFTDADTLRHEMWMEIAAVMDGAQGSRVEWHARSNEYYDLCHGVGNMWPEFRRKWGFLPPPQ
ncbi:unnamed protein product [Linum trigynum]|uniref:Uncharacterized protein n=1 Tax=Linum trigynum TaxID=586398 RepID=A0AAV2GSI3_9ROSI